MSEETTEATTEAEKETGKGLRAQLEKTLAENRELKADKMGQTFASLGLETERGLGKAIAKEYDGELSKDAIAAYAQSEYGYTAPEVVPQHPDTPAIYQEHARLDQVGQTAGSVAVPTEFETLAKAEADGDYATALQIKGEQVANMFRNQNPQTGR